jgi:hypothetical protein
VCDEEGPIMMGPIISKTLLLFAIEGITPKMMLIHYQAQIYAIFFHSIPFFGQNSPLVCRFLCRRIKADCNNERIRTGVDR